VHVLALKPSDLGTAMELVRLGVDASALKKRVRSFSSPTSSSSCSRAVRPRARMALDLLSLFIYIFCFIVSHPRPQVVVNGISLAPSLIDALDCYWRMDYAKSLKVYAQVMSSPHVASAPRLLVDVGRVHLHTTDLVGARSCLEKAHKRTPALVAPPPSHPSHTSSTASVVAA
jgi:hypothetical protein